MSKALDPAALAIVKLTAPALRLRSDDIAERTDERLFHLTPVEEVLDVAAMVARQQPQRFLRALLVYAQMLGRPEGSAASAGLLIAGQGELEIRIEHYPMLAEAMVPAIREVLGAIATDEFLSAWAKAFWAVAEIMVEHATAPIARLAA